MVVMAKGDIASTMAWVLNGSSSSFSSALITCRVVAPSARRPLTRGVTSAGLYLEATGLVFPVLACRGELLSEERSSLKERWAFKNAA